MVKTLKLILSVVHACRQRHQNCAGLSGWVWMAEMLDHWKIIQASPEALKVVWVHAECINASCLKSSLLLLASAGSSDAPARQQGS